MTTPMSLLLTALLTPSAAPALPAFQPTYDAAVKTAHEEQKPLAIFLARSATAKSLAAGEIYTPDVHATLGKDYVAVVVDLDTKSGAAVAARLGLDAGEAVVVTDRAVERKAYKSVGGVVVADLNGRLARYAAPGYEAVTTETNAEAAPVAMPAPAYHHAAPAYAPAPAYYPSAGGCASGNCGAAMSYPAYTPRSFSSCPNCR